MVAGPISRRAACLGTLSAAAFPTAAPSAATSQPDRHAWQTFRRKFVTPAGRVVDTDNGGVSHSEGQGYGMWLATRFDDQATFDRIASWTEANLSRDSDSLHAWRYLPDAADPVPDRNNATDADLAIAAAYAQAALRWGRPDWHARAAAIAADILRLNTATIAGRLLLLPGAAGFRHGDRVTLNPSYYAWPFIAALNPVLSVPEWQRLAADGAVLLQAARFGSLGLPADWIELDAQGAIYSAPDRPFRFGYDAVRVGLYLPSLGTQPPGPVAHGLRRWWAEKRPRPAWVDLTTGETAPYAASPGMELIGDLILGRLPSYEGAHFFLNIETMGYYSAVLALLARTFGKGAAGV